MTVKEEPVSQVVRTARDGSAVVVRVSDTYVSVNLSTLQTTTAGTLGALVAGGSWKLGSQQLSADRVSVACELANAAVATLGVDTQISDERRRVYRVPNVVKNECFSALQWLRANGATEEPALLALAARVGTSTSVDIETIRALHDRLSLAKRPDPDAATELSSTTVNFHLLGGSYAERWVERVLRSHKTLLSSAFEYNPDATYFGGGDDAASTNVNRLYKLENGTDYSQWDAGMWIPADAPADALVVQLDQESATALASWLDDSWDKSPQSYFELRALNPIEYNLFDLASDSLDLELLDRVESLAASAWGGSHGTQQRAESASRQPRSSDGHFNPGSPSTPGDKIQVFARARLNGPQTPNRNPVALINEYLTHPTPAPVTSAGGEPSAPAPETTTVEDAVPGSVEQRPLYVAIVDDADTAAVLDLVAITPAASGTEQGPSAWRRSNGTWEAAPDLLAELQGITPPPVIELTDDETVKGVITQIDAHDSEKGSQDDAAPPEPGAAPAPAAAPVAASGTRNITVNSAHVVSDDIGMWGPNGEQVPITAGGIPTVADTPKDIGNAERLRKYWTHGEGGAKIRWGQGGDWYRCVDHLSKFLGTRAKGYCTLRHHDATGFWPGQAPSERGLRAAGDDPLAAITFEQSLYSQAIIAAGLAAQDLLDLGEDPIPETALDVIPFDEGGAFVIPMLIPEDIGSGDERSFEPGSLTYRDLPLSLLWQIKTGNGHDGSVIVGRIDNIERLPGGGLGRSTGVFDVGPYGREAERLVRAGMLRGVSADLDKFVANVEDPEPDPEDAGTELGADDILDSPDPKKIQNDTIRVSQARVMAATLLPKPAFQECYIIMADQDDLHPGDAVETIPDGVYEEDPATADQAAAVLAALAASAAPVKPPRSWFNDPMLDKPTPLTVDDEGRVFGHIAAWMVDHIGLPRATKPPRSATNYAYFQTGVLRTDDGQDVNVGQLTLAGGHAPIRADAAAAVRHYDDTASAVADVSAGEDRHGIWVSGALRPSVTPEQVRTLRASAPSGDWRPINGRLELVAVCQVNVPGFPVARAFVASGAVMALVAAGAQYMAQLRDHPVTDLSARVEALERTELEAARSAARARFAPVLAARNEALVAAAAQARERVAATRTPVGAEPTGVGDANF